MGIKTSRQVIIINVLFFSDFNFLDSTCQLVYFILSVTVFGIIDELIITCFPHFVTVCLLILILLLQRTSISSTFNHDFVSLSFIDSIHVCMGQLFSFTGKYRFLKRVSQIMLLQKNTFIKTFIILHLIQDDNLVRHDRSLK